MADPTAIPAMALVLRPVVAFVVDVEVISKAEPEVEVAIAEVDVNVEVAIVEVDVNVEVVADVELEVEVAIVDVELFELSAVLAVELLLGLEFETGTDCVDEVLIGGAELLEEEVVVPGSIMNAGEGICDTPT